MEIVIVGAVRTPVGRFGGIYKNFSAINLGIEVVKEVLKRANIHPDVIDEVILGNVLGAGLGQNISRQIQIGANIPISSNAFTVNKVCASGLKSVILAAQSIKCEDNEIVIAGGTENMTQSPYLIPKARWGHRMNNASLIDSMINDGLWDAFNNYHMGVTAENVADKFNISREEQDQFALESQHKAEFAIKEKKMTEEIVPISIPIKKGNFEKIDTDEHPRFGSTIESLRKISPAFKKNGTVTAGNSSGLNDGAAAFILMSEKKALELKKKPLAYIRSYGWSGVDPSIMGLGPIDATKKALEKAKLTTSDLDLIEANEAFASQALSVIKQLKLDPKIVNIHGGAIALGHPIGASGSRILTTLLHSMKTYDKKLGLATLCVGGGQGVSLILERK